jgi:hypothetical protein
MKTATLDRSAPRTDTAPEDVLRLAEIDRRAEADRSIRKASITAGVGLLVMSALSGFGYLFVVKGLVTPGNAARTARDITAHETLFRFGIVSLSLVAALDVLVAWALYRVLRPVSEGISRLAAWLRVSYAGVFTVAISQLVEALRLVGHTGYLSVSSTDQLHGQVLLRVTTFTDIWNAGLVLFGLHLLVVAYLAHRSGYIPRLLGVLVAIAGFGYVFDTVSALISGGTSTPLSSFTFVGEFLLALWLVIWGRRITLRESGSQDNLFRVAR